MSNDFDSESNSPQDEANKPLSCEADAPEKKPCHLRLVVSNPPANLKAEEEKPLEPSEAPLPKTDFSVKLSKLGKVYKMVIHDHFHDLENEFHLDIERYNGRKVVTCQFPNIMEKVEGYMDCDESLYGVIAVQFQLTVLKQLFLFCRKFRVPMMTLYMDNELAQKLEVYDNFLADYDDALSVGDEESQMDFETHRHAFSVFRKYFKESLHKMEQGLWHDQRENPVIRDYLKARIRQASKNTIGE